MIELMIIICPIVGLIMLKVGHKIWAEAASVPPIDSVLTQHSDLQQCLYAENHQTTLMSYVPIHTAQGGQNVVGHRTAPSKTEGST